MIPATAPETNQEAVPNAARSAGSSGGELTHRPLLPAYRCRRG
jgi:hypothetical protein